MLDMSPSRLELRGNVMTRLTILANILFPKPRDYRQNGKFTIYFIYEPGVECRLLKQATGGVKHFHPNVGGQATSKRFYGLSKPSR